MNDALEAIKAAAAIPCAKTTTHCHTVSNNMDLWCHWCGCRNMLALLYEPEVHVCDGYCHFCRQPGQP